MPINPDLYDLDVSSKVKVILWCEKSNFLVQIKVFSFFVITSHKVLQIRFAINVSNGDLGPKAVDDTKTTSEVQQTITTEPGLESRELSGTLINNSETHTDHPSNFLPTLSKFLTASTKPIRLDQWFSTFFTPWPTFQPKITSRLTSFNRI